ncbi:MAG: exodeoxyribonuclease V subunit alpha [Planctomycetaceae bacterium]|nr:exodeoxyribonuclease V subunit alpha [Planctomycetaceae bacterium]
MSHLGLQDETQLQQILRQWLAQQWLRPLDVAWGTFLAEESQRWGAPCPAPLLLAAVLTSYQVGRGHVCLDLEAVLRDPNGVLALPPIEVSNGDTKSSGATISPAELLRGLTLDDWLADIDQEWVVGSVDSTTPLIRKGSLLYLRRYWNDEQQIITSIEQRLTNPPAIDDAQLAATLERLFPQPTKKAELDWQKVACALAARESFAVLTGGPGTGKTTTVVRLLATLQVLAAHATGRFLSIRMAAPTGKAAARLNDSLRRQIEKIALQLGPGQGQAVVDSIMTEKVSTIHRLLGTLPDGQGFRHHRHHRLNADVVVIDEASMVDVHLLSCLFAALPITTRVVLLGDKDQLASVEAGAVLGQLCSRAESANYWPSTRDWLQQVCRVTLPDAFIAQSTDENAPRDTSSPMLFAPANESGRRLDQAITMLRVSHRFGESSGIGQLARAVNAGDAKAAWLTLDRQSGAESSRDLQMLRVQQPEDRRFEKFIVDGYRPFLEDIANGPAGSNDEAVNDWAKRVLRRQASFQLLCTLRHGPWGVQGLNDFATTLLRREGYLSGMGSWYSGRPVMVTRNDYGLRLMNGDIGVTLSLSGGEKNRDSGFNPGNLHVVFPDSESPSGLRWVLPSRLGHVETVFAMTVHKSQGSEFTRVGLVLPDHSSPVLTRELIYTGITRAAEQFCLIVSNPTILREAIQRRVERTSGPITRSDNGLPANTSPATAADPL